MRVRCVNKNGFVPEEGGVGAGAAAICHSHSQVMMHASGGHLDLVV